jgi:hypothetical protein
MVHQGKRKAKGRNPNTFFGKKAIDVSSPVLSVSSSVFHRR